VLLFIYLNALALLNPKRPFAPSERALSRRSNKTSLRDRTEHIKTRPKGATKKVTEEMADAFRSRVMDILSTLGKIKSIMSRHPHVSVDSVFEILQRSYPKKEEKVGRDAFPCFKFYIHAMFLLHVHHHIC
ncbi:hypothetical protein M8C21_003782, partial [Ambrosia artemisiifolia]